jgi:hypothetical protein
MTLSEYLIEAVANRTTGKYGPEPYRDSLVKWLESKGFKSVEGTTRNIRTMNGKVYLLSKNRKDLCVHSEHIYEIMFFFSETGDFLDVKRRLQGDTPFGITFDAAVKTIEDFS